MQISRYASIEERAICTIADLFSAVCVKTRANGNAMLCREFHPLYRRQKVGGITFIRVLSWQFSYCRTFKPAKQIKRSKVQS